MKLRTLLGGFALGFGCALIGASALSQEYDELSPEQMKEMMASYLDLMKPGKQHASLDRFVGDWSTTTKMWWGGPGTPPITTTGTSVQKSVLDGRFIWQELHSEMAMPDMETGGVIKMPYTGLGITGYDNYRKTYVGAWVDSTGTQILTMRGTADPSENVITFYGEMDEPMMGMIGRTVKYVLRVIDEDTHVFEIYDLAVNEDYKVVEVTYERTHEGT